MSSTVTTRNPNRRQEWALQERWCRVTPASTMACEVWQGKTWWVPGGDGTGGEDVVDGGGPGGAVAGGEVPGSGSGDQAVPGRERA